MKKALHSSFKLKPMAMVMAIAITAQFAANVALAGSGFGTGIDTSNLPMPVPTFYANSPAGPVPQLNAGGTTTRTDGSGLPVMVNTGKALRKFVDKLPGIPGVTPATVGGAAFGVNNLGQYIPLAVAEKWVDLNGTTTSDDYYEIAAVEFSEKMHSDLPKATHLRGYVQLATAKNPGKHIALTYPNGSPILDAQGAQVYAYDNPHHLGPIIKSTKGTAVRVKFTNYLPTGAGGELFVPVDTTITGAGLGPDGVTPYTQNRAEIHLVGGQSPWISAGSPHQWVAPVGETTPYGKGVSTQNVPDMADPGNGSVTLYFPNDLSARFMFYQDRTSGLTRLNSYAGLEAGYLVTDTAETALITSKAIPSDQIPLIIEDKTFVPSNIGQQDAKWNTTAWGQPGDLWFPHVYEPNQDPTSIDGTNPVGRWDFGPLFWPIFPATAALPSGSHGDASFTPEAYLDTPVINGTAYPTLTVDPKAYRFRILNASNDRYINLALYKADPSANIAPQLDQNGNPIVDAQGRQQYFTGTEVKMVPAVGDAAGNPVGWDAVNGVQLPLPQYPMLKTNINAEPSGPSRAWPIDARAGGAPDPTTSGPDFIVIGNDGGFLPNPVDIPSQPVTYEANRRSITVGNIYGYGLLLGPAERADAIVDFSKYSGQTLIVYNDAPAPTPFNDVRNDYYTGGPDLTGSGGSYSTLPGYGPNTRTMMQIKVRNTTAAPAYDPTALVTALPAAYAASQPMPIVPAVAYNAAFGTNDADIYAHVATGSIAQPNLDFSTSGVLTITGLNLITSGGTVVAGGTVVGNATPGSGSGYDPLKPPTVVFNGGVDLTVAGNSAASAHAIVSPTTLQVTSVMLDSAGSGYTSAPTVTFANPPGTSGVGAQVAVVTSKSQSIPVLTKAEQELFDASGRYNSTGGVELPLVSGVIQTTVPLNYIDSATEIIGDNEVQIWKIVDNGLWTNSIHFAFVDVQLINRVGWDGTVKAPATNEVGWKDTLRLNPLEDVIVAMRAKRPTIPFGLPKSNRLLDPSKPVNTTGAAASGLGFTAAAGVTPALQSSNVAADFDNEFVWNSAILGHSENDLMRPVVYHPTVLVPAAPGNLTDALGNGTLTWTDLTPVAAAATLANPQNEIGFKILQAATDNNGIVVGPFTQVGAVPANVTRWTPPVPVPNVAYAVVAYNAAGDSPLSASFTGQIPVAPTTFTAGPLASNSVTLNWSGASTNNQLQVLRNGTLIATLPGTATTYVDGTVTAVMTYSYQIKAVNVFGSVSSAVLTVTTPMLFVASPTGLTATPNAAGTQVALKWTDAANNETAYLVEVSTGGAFTALPLITRTTAQKTATGGTVTSTVATTVGNVYTFRVTAVNVTGAATSTSAPVTAMVDLSAPAAPAAPTGLTATLSTATRVILTWVDNANNETAYLVAITSNGTTTTVPVTRSAAQGTSTGGSVTYNATVVAGNSYSYTVVAQATKYGLTAASSAAGPVTVNVMAPAAPTAVAAIQGTIGSRSITVNWTDAPANATNYTVQRATVTTGVVGAYANAGTVAAGVQTFLDTGRTIGRTYQYQVRANGVVGNSAYVASNAVVAR